MLHKLIINYKKLNIFIKKDRYPLSLIIKLKDRLNKAIIFIKINLYNNYYLIKIKKNKK